MVFKKNIVRFPEDLDRIGFLDCSYRVETALRRAVSASRDDGNSSTDVYVAFRDFCQTYNSDPNARFACAANSSRGELVFSCGREHWRVKAAKILEILDEMFAK